VNKEETEEPILNQDMANAILAVRIRKKYVPLSVA